MNDEILYDIALSFEQSLRPLEKRELVNEFGSSKAVLSLSASTLSALLGRKWTGNNYNPELFLKKANELYNYIKKASIRIIRYDDPLYPDGLTHIPDRPFLLYVRGNIELDYSKTIAVVGTRKPDTKGIKRTIEITNDLVAEKYTIVSGLAYGIDAIAHSSCIEQNAKTIAVLGSGIDRIYPAEHKVIAEEILKKNGALVSEYPPGFPPAKWQFPRRNRIITGLSRGVLVTQSPLKSGSLITASLAADYNRDLFVPSPSNSIKDEGLQLLINIGATEISSAQDIIDQWAYKTVL